MFKKGGIEQIGIVIHIAATIGRSKIEYAKYLKLQPKLKLQLSFPFKTKAYLGQKAKYRHKIEVELRATLQPHGGKIEI
jgi:hypothetical protein